MKNDYAIRIAVPDTAGRDIEPAIADHETIVGMEILPGNGEAAGQRFISAAVDDAPHFTGPIQVERARMPGHTCDTAGFRAGSHSSCPGKRCAR